VAIMWREVREAVCVGGWIRDSFLRSICLTVDPVQSVLFPRSLGRRVAAAAPTGAPVTATMTMTEATATATTKGIAQ
jgi:hypothetical protein